MVSRHDCAGQRFQSTIRRTFDLLSVSECFGFVASVGTDVGVHALAGFAASEDCFTDILTGGLFLITKHQSFRVGNHLEQLPVAAVRVEQLVFRFLPRHQTACVIVALVAAEVRRRIDHDDCVLIIQHLAHVDEHIQRTVIHAAKPRLAPRKPFVDLGDVLLSLEAQVIQQVVKVFRARFLGRAKVKLRVQRGCRVEQLFVGESLRLDLKLVKRLSHNRIAKDRRHHRHVARFKLARFVAGIDREIRHGKRACARLNEPCVPGLTRRFEELAEETLLNCTETAKEHFSGVHVHHSCHHLDLSKRKPACDVTADWFVIDLDRRDGLATTISVQE